MISTVPTGARVVVLDTTLASLPISEADLGLPWNWRIGPASKPVSDETSVLPPRAPCCGLSLSRMSNSRGAPPAARAI
jgi:hypothetical protein